MDKTTTLLNEGQRTTPIMQKFYDLHDAIERYNRVTAVTEKAKIGYAYGILLFIEDAIEAIKAYQKDIRHLDCHDALALNFKEMTKKSYWLKNVDRLYQELQAYGEKKLSEYKLTIGNDDQQFTNTCELYEAIERSIEKMIELLEQTEVALEAAPSELFLNFYCNLRKQYNKEQAIDDYKDKRKELGVVTYDKLRILQALLIADFVNSDTLSFAFKPSVEEQGKVNVEQFKEQLPEPEEPYQEDFDKHFVVFNRTAKWKGDIVIPDYRCAGLFIFEHWDKLREEDVNSIFYLDKMLELVNEDIMRYQPDFINTTQSVEDRIRQCIAKLMEERSGKEYVFNQQSHWQAVYRILVDKKYCADSDFEGFDVFIMRVMPDKVNKPYKKDSVKRISQTDFAKPFNEWRFDEETSKTRKPFDCMVEVAKRFLVLLEENGL